MTDKTSDNAVDRSITVTWEAEISSGAFRQNSNHGDHKIRCYARAKQNTAIERESIISVRGKYIIDIFHLLIIHVAPSLSPSDVTVVSKSTTSVSIHWIYNDTTDADGYVVYVNDNDIHKVVGGANISVTLHGLIPGTNYFIIVRAYQDILGPPSIPLFITSDNDGKTLIASYMYIKIIIIHYRAHSIC